MKGSPSWIASGAANRNPRASIPAIRSTSRSEPNSAKRLMTWRNAMGFLRRGVMSLKEMPGLGKSGTSRIYCFNSMISTTLDCSLTASTLVVDDRNRGGKSQGFGLW